MFRKAIGMIALIALLFGMSNHTSAQVAKTSFTVRIENISGGKASAFKTVGIFNKAVDAKQPGAAAPGLAFEFMVTAVPGDRLSFTTMFGQSNDWFFGLSDKGLPLYDATGKAISGDFSSEIKLWDAGTEVDEELGKGPNQGPRQAGPNTGAAENAPVHLAAKSAGNSIVPNAADYLKLTITPGSNNKFKVRIDNVSGKATLPTPISPGVFVVHTEDAPIFAAGKADRAQGLENQSEDGNPIILAHSLGTTDKQVRLSPGVFVVHTDADPLFTVGKADRGQGLEAQAEDGNPATLATATQAGKFVATGLFNTPVGAAKPGAITSGQAFEFKFDAVPGDYLSFTSMFGDSNDLFFAPDGYGIGLFNAKGQPVMGEVTIHVGLWDAGTEVNQEPFVGADQAPRQKAPNTGASETAPIQRISDVTDGFTYPSIYGMIKVTITAQNGVAINMMDPAMMPAATPAATMTK